jgi:hypothetical protein
VAVGKTFSYVIAVAGGKLVVTVSGKTSTYSIPSSFKAVQAARITLPGVVALIGNRFRPLRATTLKAVITALGVRAGRT